MRKTAQAPASLDRDAFVRRYGGVYESSPWVAEQAFEQAAGIPDPADPARLAKIFAACVDRAGDDVKLALIRSHPDLAGRAAVRGELTPESTAEQASAGIDQCTNSEFEKFQTLNRRYRDKFGFPFVMAVRGSNRHDILSAFERRLGNTPEAEIATTIGEIHKIARLRLEALGGNDD
jgi:OHCU decarboxylase